MLLQLHEWGERTSPPVVCLHGVTAHGRRFRKLAEERLAPRYRVLAPDLRGHGFSESEPPWSMPTHVADVLETIEAAGVERAQWVGHSFGGRLLLEIAAAAPERVERAVLLDPAIQILPHIGMNFAEDACRGETHASPEAAVDARIATTPSNPRPFVEEDVAEALVEGKPGTWTYRYTKAAVATIYGELCTPPPPPETVRAPTLLLYAPAFGLVRDDQLAEYRAALADRLEVVEVPGGHMVYWDAWEETAGAVERFLA
jgi:lipase